MIFLNKYDIHDFNCLVDSSEINEFYRYEILIKREEKEEFSSSMYLLSFYYRFYLSNESLFIFSVCANKLGKYNAKWRIMKIWHIVLHL